MRPVWLMNGAKGEDSTETAADADILAGDDGGLSKIWRQHDARKEFERDRRDPETLEVASDRAPVLRRDAAFQRRPYERLSFCAGGSRKQAARCSTDVSSRTSSGSMRLAPAATSKNRQGASASRRTWILDRRCPAPQPLMSHLCGARKSPLRRMRCWSEICRTQKASPAPLRGT